MLSVEAAGNNEPLSRAPGLQTRRGAQDFRRWLRKVYSLNECLWYGNVCLFFAGRKSEKKLPALAAQLRAFSSLLSFPSQAQSVIKAFRRQGIGSADEFNTARFFLSRLESLSASPTSLSFLRFRSKSSKSSEGGQGETVSSVSAFFQSYLRSSLQEADTPATDSPSLASALICPTA